MTGSTAPDEPAAAAAARAAPAPPPHHHHHHHRSSADPANAAAVPVLSAVTAHVHPLLIMIAAAMLALAASLVLLVFRHVATLVRAVAAPNPNYARIAEDDDAAEAARGSSGKDGKGRPVGARGSPPRARGTTRGVNGNTTRPEPTGDRGWPLESSSSSQAKRPVLPIARPDQAGSDEESDDHGPWKVLCDGGGGGEPTPNTPHVVLPGGWWPSATPFPMHDVGPDPAVPASAPPAAPPAPPELLAAQSPSAPVVPRVGAPTTAARPPDPASTTKPARTPPLPSQGPDPGRVRAIPPPGPGSGPRGGTGETIWRDVKPPAPGSAAVRPTSAPAAVPVPTKPTGGKRRSRGKAGRAHKPPQIVPPPAVVVVAAPTPTPTPTPPPAAASTTAATTTTSAAAPPAAAKLVPGQRDSDSARDSPVPPASDARQTHEARAMPAVAPAVDSQTAPAARAARTGQDASVHGDPVPAPVPAAAPVTTAAPADRVRPSRARAMPPTSVPAVVPTQEERIAAPRDAAVTSSLPPTAAPTPVAVVPPASGKQAAPAQAHAQDLPVDPRLRPAAHRTPPRADLEPFPSLAPSPSPPPPPQRPAVAATRPAAPVPAPLRVDRAPTTSDVRTARAATVPTTPTVAEQSSPVPVPVSRPTAIHATATQPSPPVPAAVVSPVVPAGTTAAAAAAAAAALRGRSQSWSPFSGLDLDQPVRSLLGGNTAHDPTAAGTPTTTAAAAGPHDWYAPHHGEYLHDAAYPAAATAPAPAPFGYDPHDAYAAFRHDPYTAYLPAPAPDPAAAAAAQRMLQAMVDHQRRFHAAAAAAAAAVSPGVEYAGGKPKVSPLLVEGMGYAAVDLAQHGPGEVFARAHLAGGETEGETYPGEDGGARSRGASLVEMASAAGETMSSFHPATTTMPPHAPPTAGSPTSDLDRDNDSDLSGTPTPAVPYPTVTSPPRPWTTSARAWPASSSKYGPVGARPVHAYPAAYPAAAAPPTAPAWAALHAHAVARRHPHHVWPTAPAAAATLPHRRPSTAAAAGYAYPAPWSATHGGDAWTHDHAGGAADAWGHAEHAVDAWGSPHDEDAAAAAAWAHAYAAAAAAASAWRAPSVVGPHRGHAEDDAAFDPFAPAPVVGVGQEEEVGAGEGESGVAAEAP
ncbi:hypothetical protein GGF32_005669 [Allomyces javanicus]|nr:hypothetical protein GGF32_005669 [Allomyces javanicus]